MRKMHIIYILRGADCAAGFVACAWAVTSRLLAKLPWWPVQLFSCTASFIVSRLSRLLFRCAPPVFSFGCFSLFYFQHPVAMLASNPALKGTRQNSTSFHNYKLLRARPLALR